MPDIKLPDGSIRHFDQPVTGKQVAEAIGPGLAKAALGCKIDGKLSDLSTVISGDCSLQIVTPVNRDKSEEAMNKMAVVGFGDKDCAGTAGKSQKKFSQKNSIIILSSHPLSLLSSAGEKRSGRTS